MKLRVHAQEELFVALGAFETAFGEIHGFDGVHIGEELAQYPHTVESLLVVQQVVTAGT